MKAKSGNGVNRVLVVILAMALLGAGWTGSAIARDGSNGSGTGGKKHTPHRKCNKKPKVGAKTTSNKKRKCHKRKPIKPAPPVAPVVPPVPPVTPPVTPPTTPPATTTLAITPATFDYGTVQHGGFTPSCTSSCPSQTFTVTNTGSAASGVPAAAIVELRTPETGVHPAAFAISANTCTAAIAPGASCTVTVKFAPNSNAGDEIYQSRLDVTASPGSTVSSTLDGMST